MFLIHLKKVKYMLLLVRVEVGKQQLLSLSSGLDKPDEGKVLFKGKDIQEIGLNKYRREDISIVFQSYNSFTI